MRFKIHFQLSGQRQWMPLNNQYPISAWIYKILNAADEEFAKLLHDIGYQLETGKTFKLFTFSRLEFPRNTIRIKPGSDRMEVWARNAFIIVSFHLPQTAEKFITGLFIDQHAFIGDKISGVQMHVESIEVIKTDFPDCEKLQFKTITPLVLGISKEEFKNEQYTQPLDSEYKEVFIKSLLDKHQAILQTGFEPTSIDFKIIKLYTKTAMQTIKAFTPAETKVKGYYFDFELKAPKSILELGFNAGFGNMSSLGFGYTEIIYSEYERASKN